MISFLEKHRFVSLIFLIAIAVEIFYFSTLTGTEETNIPCLSYIYHFVVFFLLSFFCLITIKGNNPLRKKHFLLTFLLSIIYAISDEIHQMFVPLRNASLADILVDSLGICFALSIGFLMRKYEKQQISLNKRKNKNLPIKNSHLNRRFF